ncbi:MAG: hypothetical protein ABI668_09695 [Sphingorhabdus sp.]
MAKSREELPPQCSLCHARLRDSSVGGAVGPRQINELTMVRSLVCSIEQADALCRRQFGNGSPIDHELSHRLDQRTCLSDDPLRRDQRYSGNNWHNRFAINMMLAAHFLDWQKAHDDAACKPDQQLRADNQREPW